MQSQLISFIQKTYQQAGKTKAVIAVSGGIDSAVSLSLLAQAFEKATGLSKRDIFPVFLPYADQDMSDAKEISRWNKISEENWQEVNIEPMVRSFEKELNMEKNAQKEIRLGNIMARVRMMVMYDLAKHLDALVCGTENRSERYLGYFTRFGDGASDLEPIVGLYKTQVRELAQQLKLPEKFIKKAPSAGLWDQQTDEQELGFSYQDADRVLVELFDNNRSPEDIFQTGVPGVSKAVVSRVIERVQAMAFKLKVPYEL